jgi:hypothetical protein
VRLLDTRDTSVAGLVRGALACAPALQALRPPPPEQDPHP